LDKFFLKKLRRKTTPRLNTAQEEYVMGECMCSRENTFFSHKKFIIISLIHIKISFFGFGRGFDLYTLFIDAVR